MRPCNGIGLHIEGRVGSVDGLTLLQATQQGATTDAEALGVALAPKICWSKVLAIY